MITKRRARALVIGRAIAALVAVGAVAAVAGCGSGSRSAPLTASTTTPVTNSSPVGSGPTAAGTATTAPSTTRGGTVTTRPGRSGTLTLTEKDDGTTVTAAAGTTIIVVLSSTYWMFPTAPNRTVLQQHGGVTATPAPFGTCVPGGGCGTVSVTYEAVGTGPARIAASRTSCGEAMGCTGTAGSYAVTVVISGG